MFDKISTYVTNAAGSLWAFMAAFIYGISWVIGGRPLAFSDIADIFILLLVFANLHCQNKDTLAMHIKLNELIKSIEQPDSELSGIEEKTEDELKRIKENY